MIYYQGVKDVYMHPLSIILGPPGRFSSPKLSPIISLLLPGKLQNITRGGASFHQHNMRWGFNYLHARAYADS